ncbi:DgyrCDS1436 [Dimorphilus gyrociliatus]|uniref:DgyrCDS1436 n=1 Tax=Dimorphilus gyrociliatus TaxID=2664684 RepID=A0A7I8VCD5_9ANNE|nr:DgyrCDS1436 [Dimorphilus gyrociliatus]
MAIVLPSINHDILLSKLDNDEKKETYCKNVAKGDLSLSNVETKYNALYLCLFMTKLRPCENGNLLESVGMLAADKLSADDLMECPTVLVERGYGTYTEFIKEEFASLDSLFCLMTDKDINDVLNDNKANFAGALKEVTESVNRGLELCRISNCEVDTVNALKNCESKVLSRMAQALRSFDTTVDNSNKGGRRKCVTDDCSKSLSCKTIQAQGLTSLSIDDIGNLCRTEFENYLGSFTTTDNLLEVTVDNLAKTAIEYYGNS